MNPRKRPLLSVGKPNKYSSGSNNLGRGSKKRALSARPPQPKSVVQLESFLNEATKKKKEKLETKSNNRPNGSNGKGVTISRKDSKRKSNDENTRNEASVGNNHNRWSHVNPATKSKNRGVVNPFLEAKRKPKVQNTKIVTTLVSKGKKDRTKKQKLSKSKGFAQIEKRELEISGNDENNGATIISRNAMEVSCEADQSKPDFPSFDSEATSSNLYESQIDSSSRQHSAPIDQSIDPKPTAHKSVIVDRPSPLCQNAIINESIPTTISKVSNNKNEGKSNASEPLRPKLGLKLSSKSIKGKISLVSTSKKQFHSSLPIPSSHNEHAPIPTTTVTENEPEQLRQDMRVLSSPGKSDTAPTIQPGTAANSGSASWKSTSSTNTTKRKSTSKKNVNDNFVRLNMKNKAGACRGARNKGSKFSKERRSWTFRSNDERDQNDGIDYGMQGSFANPTLTFDAAVPPSHSTNSEEYNDDIEDERFNRRFHKSNELRSSKSNATSYVSKMSGLDPLDEFVDGTFGSSTEKKPVSTVDSSKTCKLTAATVFNKIVAPKAPMCARHQRPCKLIKVKKATTGNKGREFYACSMPRGEQCDHFQWADDTVEAARTIIAKNSSYSAFITRQVAAYVDRFRALTVPELQQETSRRGLNKNGKKQQLLMRLAIWTRDELVKCSPELADEETENDSKSNDEILLDSSDEDGGDSDDDSCSSSEDELEIFNDNEESEEESSSAFDDEEMVNSSGDPFGTVAGRKSNVDGSLTASLQEIFGHTSFREGQEWAIQRCLDQQSSLLVAPTGFGKSLCYALPAALMDGVCIVVSPLISLIQDQLRSLPPRVPAATLSGSISTSKTAAILDDIVRKRLKILFVSPERLTSPAFRRLFNLTWNPDTKTKERRFPEISLLCIDEAHCISQWAHNFRPCFLRFKGFLKIMKPKSVLAITATAGPRVIKDIGQTLGMEFPESITEEAPKKRTDTEHESIKIIDSGRDNIDVMGKYLSNQEERLAVVAGILTPATAKGKERKLYAGRLAKGSVIVYVWRQKDTEVVAESLTAAGVAGGVVVYHGGMNANARAKSQSRFMRGKARICVATVAFGLGIDKADIVGIVHLYLSNSPEHYLQEIGRAGRDGRSATAIALPLLEEVPTRHSLAHSNLVSKSQIRSLLGIIKRLVETAGNNCDMANSSCGRFMHIALPVHSTVRACDCKPETVETFLSLIERIGGDNPLLHIEGYNYDGASIALKKRTLKKLAEREPLAISIQAVSQCIDAPLVETGKETDKVSATSAPKSFQRHFLAYSKGSHSFSISQCANRLGHTAEPRHVFAALRRLQSSNELEFVLDTSQTGRIFQLKISEIGFSMFQSNDYSSMEDNLVDTIFESFSSSCDSGASKFLDMHYMLDQVSTSSELSTDIADDDSDSELSSNKSPSLLRFQELTRKYFAQGLQSERLSMEGLLPESFSTIREKELKIDGLSLLRDLPPLFEQTSSDSESILPPEHLKLGVPATIDYTALAITKFLHGIDAPRTPYLTFRQYPLFGKWKTVHFGLIHESIRKVLESRL